MASIRITAFIISLIIILPMFLIPNSFGYYIRDPSEDMSEEEADEQILGLFNKRTFSLLMLVLIDGFYYLFLVASMFPVIFFLIWSSLTKRYERKVGQSGGVDNGKYITDPEGLSKTRKKRNIFKLTRNYTDKSPIGVDREAAFPLHVRQKPIPQDYNPDVSLIVPCFNEEQNVAQTIENAYLQDYPGNMVIIIVDDGSQDNTYAISKILAGKSDTREVKVIKKPNGGKASAINFGLKEATGEIIVSTDGDSHFDENCVTNIVNEFKKHPHAGIVGGFVLIRNTDKGYLVKLQQMEYILTQHLIRIPQSDMGNVLIEPGPVFGMRSELAKRYSCQDRTCCEDVDLTQTVLGSGYQTRTALTAVSRTEAPTKWKAWYNQRKRWIYGQYQSWRENKDFLKKNPWGIYMYFTWVANFVYLLFLLGIMTLIIILLPALYVNQYLFVFISVRTIMIFTVYFIVRILILSQYKEGRRTYRYLPIKILYDMGYSMLAAFLYFKYITGLGIKIHWGRRTVKLK